MSLPDQPHRSPSPAPYSKPSEIGGTLIRKVLSLFKEEYFRLPFAQDVIIAVSGGVDSMVLAHLVCTYGRKIADPGQITLLHLDHGWRKESANEEKTLVENLAKSLQVKFIHETLQKPTERMSSNLEEDGRLKRQAAYARLLESRPPGSFILTAHHETDLVESIFWRFMRGEFTEFREGIKFQDSNCIRPFLKVTKEEIVAYAQAEKVSFLTDPTNADPAFYRGWMRTEVVPLLKSHFPGFEKNLSKYLTKRVVDTIKGEQETLLAVQTVTGSALNRAQRKALHEMTLKLSPGGALSLPGGTQIRRTPDGFFIEKLDDSDRRK